MNTEKKQTKVNTPQENSELQEAIRFWENHRKTSPSKLEADKELRYALKYVFILTTEACIEIGKEIAGDMRLPLPESNAGTFFLLAKNKFMDHDLAERMMHISRFRNKLVHDYSMVDNRQLSIALEKDLTHIKKFYQLAERHYKRQGHQSLGSALLSGMTDIIKKIFG